MSSAAQSKCSDPHCMRGRCSYCHQERQSPSSPRRGARLVLLGGEPLDGPRFIWWNLVSSSRERIEQAKVDWVEGRFSPVPGETEFIPLPDK